MNAVVALLPARPAGTNTTCANTIFANDLSSFHNALNDVTLTEHARTAELMNAGLRKISQKVVEEAAEVALEAVREADPKDGQRKCRSSLSLGRSVARTQY